MDGASVKPAPPSSSPPPPPPPSSSPPPSPTIAGVSDSAAGAAFECCVCLDLLYKPVVLSCGHLSCFWCVHKSMDTGQTSHCAICRQPYNFFPSICQLLHHILLKIAPVVYKRREKEVLEEERSTGTFSPQFLDGPVVESVHSEILAGNLEEKRCDAPEESNLAENSLEVGMCTQVSVDDVLCGLCKGLLFQPAVLNCGHVYCRSCLPIKTGKLFKCHICEGLHPGDLPNVCLDLDHFLEERFPREYSARKEKEKKEFLERVCPQEDSSSSASQTEERNTEAFQAKVKELLGIGVDAFNAHWAVGCDSCGMYPLFGKRYRCKDCKERVGFDLCEACYNTSSKLPGRFNQQHTPDHEFEIDDSMLIRKLLIASLRRGDAPNVDDDAPEGGDDALQ